jgi:hypothetical protein
MLTCCFFFQEPKKYFIDVLVRTPSRLMSREYHELGHNHFLPHSSQFINNQACFHLMVCILTYCQRFYINLKINPANREITASRSFLFVGFCFGVCSELAAILMNNTDSNSFTNFRSCKLLLSTSIPNKNLHMRTKGETNGRSANGVHFV